ncbi:hypothetical protein [Adlercreutzia aquisgranensis]|uniref:hypothetical protein n=1 Tax=Adlercreutzia aquisgranensis TaxID=2941323 RepID=UPI00204099CC|nr:hypothetical protein [Adlercreutzia aquisgranensis]
MAGISKMLTGFSRGHGLLVAGSLTAALCSTVGFAFAVPPALDARTAFDSLAADAALPQESDDSTEGEPAASSASPAARNEAQQPNPQSGSESAAKSAEDAAGQPKTDEAEGDGQADDGKGDAAGEGAPASSSPSVTARQYASAPSSAQPGASGASDGSSADSPSNSEGSSGGSGGGNAEASAEPPAADPEQEAYDARHSNAWTRMQEMPSASANVAAVLSNVFASLPVSWYDGGFTTEGIATWGDASYALADANSCIATCDAYLADYGADEFPDLAPQAAVWAERWQNLRNAASLLSTFCSNYLNCPDRANPNDWEWTCTDCYTSVLSGHTWSVPVGGGWYGGKLDYLEAAAEAASRL